MEPVLEQVAGETDAMEQESPGMRLAERIRSIRYYLAGNVYSRNPVIRLRFEEDVVLPGAIPTEEVRRMLAAMPVLRLQSLDFSGWRMLESATAPVPAIALIEVLALLLQRSVNWPAKFYGSSRLRNGGRPRTSVVFGTREYLAGRHAGQIAVDLFDRLFVSGSEDWQGTLAEGFDTYRRRTARVTARSATMWLLSRAEERGINWTLLPGRSLLRIGRGRHAETVRGTDTGGTSGVSTQLARHKDITRDILKTAGLPVPEQYIVRDAQRAVRAAHAIGFPVVVKPSTGNRSRAVSVGLRDDAAVEAAFDAARTVSRQVLVEAEIPGDTYRLTVIGGHLFAAARRQPPTVTGDGTASVAGLIQRANRHSERQPGGIASMAPIEPDEDMLALISEQGLSLDAVPEAGRKVFLRRLPVSPYGEPVDVTDEVAPSIRQMAEQTAKVFGLPTCGIDFVAPDITRPVSETGGAICEVNSLPTLDIHTEIESGTRRDAVEAILDMLYSDGRPSSFPMIVVLSEPGARTAEQALADALSARGLKVAMVSGGDPEEPEMSRSRRAALLGRRLQALEMDDTVDLAIVSVSEDDVIKYRVGLQRADLAVLPELEATPEARRAVRALKRLARQQITRIDDPDLVMRALEPVATGPAPDTGADALVARKGGRQTASNQSPQG